ncbi:hypothetical protein RXV86_03645 [Alisedimentitalea sp. MJ-SS2]|uniref:hypothetical protein n=1 Tax=Aliisedimentitalea sp. MJ-SS2 TaxID=3049795 RepID=UPI00290636CA|nr:hypothetical protein [Alisedimentitalea sp. MJ-SS2]MDU8926471.1 hypothetical protein [Alisedimentitalea sp. MJ-SS2]
MKGDALDPKALIREAYRMEVGPPECRVIFLDWALSLPEGTDPKAAIVQLLQRYGADETHPMTQVLHEGLAKAERTGRRGGRRGRLR